MVQLFYTQCKIQAFYTLKGGGKLKFFKDIFCRFREQIFYLVFGGLTTLLNLILFAAGLRWISGPYQLEIANWGAWILSVLFAYATNRRWVFESKVSGAKPIIKELSAFVGARLLSGVIDYGILWLGVRVFDFAELPTKLVATILAIILNYVFSKWLVFRKP